MASPPDEPGCTKQRGNATPIFDSKESKGLIMKAKTMSTTTRPLQAFAFALGLAACAIPAAHAATFGVVHNFGGTSDGAFPLNGLTADGSGNLYGAASSGGASNYGVVFKMDTSGVVTVLYNFKGGTDGADPEGHLMANKAGSVFGTTAAGGASGAGTVFRITAAGKEQVLYSFAGGSDGSAPQAGLTRDKAGNLYGTTYAGGANGNGTVFKLSLPARKGAHWTEKVLYSFGTGTDGATPVGGVAFDAAGNIYGTTSAQGAGGYGTVFQLTRSGSTWTESTLHDFQNADDGAIPYAGLIYKGGNFYGAATEGGVNEGGTIFELTPSGSSWNFTVIYSVPGWGISGTFRDVLMDKAGAIYGTTHCDGDDNAGTVYKLTPSGSSWNYTLLYTFTGGTDGLYSFSNLVLKGGSVYGTTNSGGANGMGVIFSVKP
jgi:uncharacterized repeat protein (TIGR03803 family)